MFRIVIVFPVWGVCKPFLLKVEKVFFSSKSFEKTFVYLVKSYQSRIVIIFFPIDL